MSNETVKIDDVLSGVEKKLAFTKTFTVQYDDPDTGKLLNGQFTVKRASLGDLGQFGIIKSQLNGGQVVDRGIDWMNEMIAFCQVTLADTPQWWDPINLYDQTLLVKVYNHVRSFQDSFRVRRVAEQRGAAANDGSGSSGNGLAPEVVVQEVQPPT
jgi:hypothetical protein